MCLRILYSYNPRHSPTHVESIRLIVREMDGVAHCTGPANKKEIHLSIEYLSKFLADHKNDLQVLRTEVEGVLIHELTHVWQRTCLRYPGGLVEGVADWVRLVAGYVPAHWKQKREGKWDAGYCPTAFFLAWINDQLQVTATNSTTTTPSFVQALNHYVGSLDSWNAETVFMKLADGKTVDQLWTTYCLEEEEITDAVADRIRAENVSLISNLKTLVQIAETETDPAVLRRLNAMVGKAVNQFLK
ncbi:peptidase of plants and bacteria-domain-containing protein [Obelidium mucronatum]|nr:peptidase of plants and bacteria-domain-containing protein [Obelidium mucronatum]